LATYQEKGSVFSFGLGSKLQENSDYFSIYFGFRMLDVTQKIANGFSTNPYFQGGEMTFIYRDFSGRQAGDSWFTDYLFSLSGFYELNEKKPEEVWLYQPASNNFHERYLRQELQICILDAYFSDNFFVGFSPKLTITEYNFSGKAKGYFQAALVLEPFYKGSQWSTIAIGYQSGGNKVANRDRWIISFYVNLGSLEKIIRQRL